MSVVVIGGGSAGLAVSHELGVRGIEHLVLERARVGQAWRDRWDSFTLVTPNWSLSLPGSPYAGPDPEGFDPRDAIVAYLEDYARGLAAPITEGVEVTALMPDGEGGLLLATSEGPLSTDAAVVCTGSFRRPHRPAGLEGVSAGLVLDAGDYRSPDQLPPGRILVVGSGQTGVQLAEELALAGRDVVLAAGRAPWIPRRLDGTDTVTWLERAGFFEATLADLPSPAARLISNPLVTGRAGGHDLNLRTLGALGVQLAGRVEAADGERIAFRDDLAASVAFGDERWADLRGFLAARLPARGHPVPGLPEPEPCRARAVGEVRTRDLAAVVLAAGYRPDYSWIDAPVCDELGFPVTRDGASIAVPGLYFCGVHFMRTRASGILFGVGRDAAVVAEQIAGRAA